MFGTFTFRMQLLLAICLLCPVFALRQFSNQTVGRNLRGTIPHRHSHPGSHRDCSEKAFVPSEAYHGQGLEDKHVFERYFSCAGRNPILRGGTYLELGALDGIKFSNTAFFDRALGWSGVLIEPSSEFSSLQKNRGGNAKNKLFHSAVCDQEGEIDWIEGDVKAVSGIASTMPDDLQTRFHSAEGNHVEIKHETRTKIRCASLAILLREAGVTEIDLFSLDVEGAELVVLNTMDWTIPVHVLVVELDGNNPEKDEGVRELLRHHHMQLKENNMGFGGNNEVWTREGEGLYF